MDLVEDEVQAVENVVAGEIAGQSFLLVIKAAIEGGGGRHPVLL